MIVTCSNCSTKYNLPDEKIAPGGSKVKCSKCGHLFKVTPPAPPEEEVEALLEEDAPTPEPEAADDFDKTFDEVAEEETTPPAEEKEQETGVDAPPAEDFDDLFDDLDDSTPEEEQPAEEAPAEEEESLFDEAADEEESLFEDDADEDDDDSDDLFEDEGDEEDADEDEDEDEEDAAALFDGDLALDEKPKKKSLKSVLILLIVLLAIGGAAYFKVWNMIGLDLGSYVQNIPYVGSWFSDEETPEAEPGESPEQRVNKIELKNVRQFYAKNEKAGILFVIQGTAVNNFAKPKERIKVKAQLFDAQSKVVAENSQLCGNVLSMFQLQVQSKEEIEDGLKSEVGILSNNTFLRPGASTPFMFVFFEQPVNDIKEFVVKVVDAENPE